MRTAGSGAAGFRGNLAGYPLDLTPGLCDNRLLKGLDGLRVWSLVNWLDHNGLEWFCQAS